MFNCFKKKSKTKSYRGVALKTLEFLRKNFNGKVDDISPYPYFNLEGHHQDEVSGEIFHFQIKISKVDKEI